MGRILTNNISLAYSIEASLGVLNTSGEWKLLEPNDITTFGATITTVARSPISKDRQRRKGTVTDLDSAAEFEHDLTREVFIDFAEGFVFSTFQGNDYALLRSGAAGDNLVGDAALAGVGGTPPGYAHDALAAAIPAGSLVFARGFTDMTNNNGLFEVDTGGSTTETPIVSGAQTDEIATQAQNATLELAGVAGTLADLDIDVTGTVVTLTSASALDFTTLGLTVGQLIHVGGTDSTSWFDQGGTPFAGYFRITAITATTLVGDKGSSSLVTNDGVGDTVDLLFGRFLRNVSTDDADFLERSYQFEAALPNLASNGDTRWEYNLGNFANTMAVQLPLADKALITFGFIGTDTQVPTSTQATNADTPTEAVQTGAYNTSADVLRLRIQQVDETGLTTCFKDVTLTLNNNVTPEKCLGTLGALFINTGNFEVNLEGQILFTNEDVASAVRNNERVTMDILIINDDGGISIDIPSMTLGGGDKEFPVNESVLMNLTGEAYNDPVLGTSIGISLFPILPSS